MSISSKYILQQGGVIAGMGRLALEALVGGEGKGEATYPGSLIERELAPRDPRLIKAYVRNVGGDPRAYKKHIPAHFFPQWGFVLATETLRGVPYSLLKAVNGGCRIEVRRRLPQQQPLNVTAQLLGVDDNGSRAVFHQRVITGTNSAPEAIVADLYPIVPLGGKKDGSSKKPKYQIPTQVRELWFGKIGTQAGLDFAKLTGDFNPIHWVPAYARAVGFKNIILHGFGTMSRTWEVIQKSLCGPGQQVTMLDVKFTRPLVLPARVGIFVDEQKNVYVGAGPGTAPALVGNYQIGEIGN